ncbi:MAG TPA: hypothetical protein VIQ31_23875, partial [Phormidium sp.]
VTPVAEVVGGLLPQPVALVDAGVGADSADDFWVHKLIFSVLYFSPPVRQSFIPLFGYLAYPTVRQGLKTPVSKQKSSKEN